MKAEFLGKEKNIVSFSMEFTAEEFDASLQKAYMANKGRFSVDGFRKGKAPRSIIERLYGEGIFFEDGINSLLEEHYPKALADLDIDSIDRPDVEFGEEKIEKGKGFKAVFKTPVAPEAIVKDYKGIAAERKVHTVTDEEVEKEIEAKRERSARLVTVQREAALHDTVVLDYKGFVDDKLFDGGSAENYNLELGSNSFIPGFEDQLVGAKAGDYKDVVVTFPEEYHAEELAGKEAVFRCLVHEVKELVIPELNDDFVQDISETLNTVDELRAETRKNLEESAAKVSEYNGKNAVMEVLYAATDVEIPEIMITDEEAQMVAEFEQELSYQGIDLNTYCKYIGKTTEDLKKEFAEPAMKRIKSRLICEAVAKAEGITATDEDIEKELTEMAAQYGMSLEDLKKALPESQMPYIRADIRNRKATDFLYENACFTDVAENTETAEDAQAEESVEAAEETEDKAE